jgi:hypothetical protein
MDTFKIKRIPGFVLNPNDDLVNSIICSIINNNKCKCINSKCPCNEYLNNKKCCAGLYLKIQNN